MSTTTGSLGLITRSETSWCGLALFGPEPTMTKSALRCPAATIASAMSPATSRSVVVLSFLAPRDRSAVLNEYAVLRARAVVEPSDDAWDLLDRLTKVYMA